MCLQRLIRCTRSAECGLLLTEGAVHEELILVLLHHLHVYSLQGKSTLRPDRATPSLATPPFKAQDEELVDLTGPPSSEPALGRFQVCSQHHFPHPALHDCTGLFQGTPHHKEMCLIGITAAIACWLGWALDCTCSCMVEKSRRALNRNGRWVERCV